MFGWTFYAATLGAPCLFALIWDKVNTPGILSGMASGFAVSIAWKLADNPLGIGSTIAGVVFNFLMCVIVSLVTCKKYHSKSITR